MRSIRRTANLTLYNVFEIVAILVFMAGYFRGRPRSIDLEEAWLKNETYVLSTEAPFDKVIFMLVDGLRSDFVYGENSGFNFTQGLIRSGEAVPFTAKAAPPTLTVSRLKALTQGTPQSFLDAWLNVLNSADAMRLEGEDTWLSRLKASRNGDKKIVYIGVDMWVMLYPDIFDRAESLHAYYLPDFKRIDTSIAQSLPHELEQDDWAALVMHFDGLDCIAHQGGILSSHMVPKQKEMDDVVRSIYKAIQTDAHLEDTLLVLLGDHGLTEGGNHGGDTPAEIASAMAFLSPKFSSSTGRSSPLPRSADYNYYSIIHQVDLVPTLAGLLGFEIPTKSTGLFVSELLNAFDSTKAGLLFLYENAVQLKGVFDLRMAEQGHKHDDRSPPCTGNCGKCGTQQDEVQCLWQKVEVAYEEYETSAVQGRIEGLVLLLREFSGKVQEILSVPLNDLHFPLLASGLALLFSLAVALWYSYYQADTPSRRWSWTFAALMVAQAAAQCIPSIVFNEHTFWYPVSLLWIWYLGSQESNRLGMRKCMVMVCLQIFTQCLDPNNASPKVLGRWVDRVLTASPEIIWILATLPYVFTARNLLGSTRLIQPLILLAAGILSFSDILYKACSVLRVNPEFLEFLPTSMVTALSQIDRNGVLQLFWAGLIVLASLFYAQARLFKKTDTLSQLVGVVNLYLISQTRVRNVVLYAVFERQLDWLLSQELDVMQIMMSGLILGQSAFFAFGRDNSFASLDLMNGYNGLDGTSVPPVFFQTLSSNWIGPIWWSFACLRLLSKHTPRGIQPNQQKAKMYGHGVSKQNGDVHTPPEDQEPGRTRVLLDYLTLQTIFSTVNAAAIMVACIWLRDDGALWTIMAPKYVNVVIWAMYHQFLVNVILCGGLWFLV